MLLKADPLCTGIGLAEVNPFIREVIVHIIRDDHVITISVFCPEILIHNDLIQNISYSSRVCEIWPIAEVLHDVQ